MEGESSLSNPHLFALYAADDVRIWSLLVGKKIKHRTLGTGRVTEVSRPLREHAVADTLRAEDFPDLRISVEYDHPSTSGSIKRYIPKAFTSEVFDDVSLPADIDREAMVSLVRERQIERERAIREAVEREHAIREAEKRLIERQRAIVREAEERARAEREETARFRAEFLAKKCEQERIQREQEAARQIRLRELARTAESCDPKGSEAGAIAAEIQELASELPLEEQIPYAASLPRWLHDHAALVAFLNAIGEAIISYGAEKRLTLIRSLPSSIVLHPCMWPRISSLPHSDQVEVVWSLPPDAASLLWSRLQPDTKVLCVYRAAQEGRVPSALRSALDDITNEPPMVQCALLILSAGTASSVDGAFAEAHAVLQDWIVKAAWLSTEPLELHPLLPNCLPGRVQHCEGRRWLNEDERAEEECRREEARRTGGLFTPVRASKAFCPRAQTECGLFRAGGRMTSWLWGARLYADRSQNWSDWSLLELLEAKGVTPAVAELSNPDEYVTSTGGWINRLNEIRARMKCSRCSKPMTPNRKYAKNLARYRHTVMSCDQGGDHDTNVYFNHCWACREPIDSRESQFQVEGFYVCIHCGSGPPDSHWFSQGDICPNCGAPDMESGGSRERICRSEECGHSIRLPAQQHRTGELRMRLAQE